MKKILNISLAAVAALGMVACSQESPATADNTPSESRGLTFKINAPEAKDELVLSREVTMPSRETAIAELDVYIFQDGAHVGSGGSNYANTDVLTVANSGANWTVTVDEEWLEEHAAADPATFYFVANDNMGMDSDLAVTDMTGVTEDYFVESIMTGAFDAEYIRTSTTMYMTAIAKDIDLRTKSSVNVNLKRRQARFDIYNDDAENVRISAVWFENNVSSKVSLFSEHTGTCEAYLYGGDSGGGSWMFNQTTSGVDLYEEALYDNEDHLLQSAFFINPMTLVSYNDIDDATDSTMCVVASVNGSPEYQFDMASGLVKDILPNHRYVIKLNTNAMTFSITPAEYTEGSTIDFE